MRRCRGGGAAPVVDPGEGIKLLEKEDGGTSDGPEAFGGEGEL
jgi:hypothetical protein